MLAKLVPIIVVVKDGHGGKHVIYGHDGWIDVLDCHLCIGHVCMKTKPHSEIRFHISL
jgi:hypothetical protein